MSNIISTIEIKLSEHYKIHHKEHNEIHVATHRSHNPVALRIKELKNGVISISVTNDKNQYNQNNHEYSILAGAIEDAKPLLDKVFQKIFEGQVTSKNNLNIYQVSEVTFDSNLFDVQTLVEKIDEVATIITDTNRNILG
tara:strand:- start:523 stop:942 length:420 start_codon:yes stop_codon:yes gene_type:complete